MEEPRLDTQEMEEKTFTDVSNQRQSSSILDDRQGQLADNSMKRGADGMENGLHYSDKESKKRRRSSLSTCRRSITGDIKPLFDLKVESNSQTGGSQANSTETGRSSPDPPSKESLLPNPKNLQMDVVISETKAKIESLTEECKKWNDLSQKLTEKQTESSKLVGNDVDLTLPMPDIPEEWKKEARAMYITCEPVNLQEIVEQAKLSVLEYHKSKNSCIRDLNLINETVQIMQESNHHLRAHFLLSQTLGSMANSLPDPRQTIANVLATTPNNNDVCN